MRIKGRLKEIFEHVPHREGPVYDLFCDHGLLGEAFLEMHDCRVGFNDKREHLISEIRQRHPENSRAFFETCNAEDLIFEKGSRVIMAGVGGMTMISCFQSWLKSHKKEDFETLEFIISPHYYCFELRNFLNKLGFKYNSLVLISDGRQIYELSRVCFPHKSEEGVLFESSEWESFGEIGRKYLSYTLKNLSNKSVLMDWERELLENIKHLILSGDSRAN
jgi:tRNA A22 N-methylase